MHKLILVNSVHRLTFLEPSSLITHHITSHSLPKTVFL